jgi:hypothetical protein
MTNEPPPPDYRPTGNFLKDFVNFCSGTEIPSIFAMWCGISGISAALGRRCYIDMGTYSVYPNFYILLVAGSGRNRKSTSIKQIEKVIKQLQPIPNLISQSITPQGLIDAIKVTEVNDSKHLLRETCTGLSSLKNLRRSLIENLTKLDWEVSLYHCSTARIITNTKPSAAEQKRLQTLASDCLLLLQSIGFEMQSLRTLLEEDSHPASSLSTLKSLLPPLQEQPSLQKRKRSKSILRGSSIKSKRSTASSR